MRSERKIFRIAYFSLVLVVLVFAFLFYKAVFSYLLISVFFSFLFNPLVVLIEGLGVKRVYAILIFYVIFFSNVVLLGNILVPTLIRQLQALATVYTDFINQPEQQTPLFAKWESFYSEVKTLFPFVDFDSVQQRLTDWSNDLMAQIPNLIVSYSSNVFKLFTYLVSVPVISFFLLKDHIFLRNKFYAMIPNKYFEIVLIIFDKINDTIGKYIRALFIQSSIIAILASTVLSILGIRFGILIGILAGVLNVVPYLGPLVGIILGGLTVILTGGSTSLLVWTMLGMYCVQICDNAVVYPLVMGKNTNLHPVLIILTVIAGGITFGMLGMLVAVPTVFLTVTFFRVLYLNLKQFEII